MVIHSGYGACVAGAMTALVTPFRDGEVDWLCLDRLVERQIEGSIDCLVVAGTTGEFRPTSDPDRPGRPFCVGSAPIGSFR